MWVRCPIREVLPTQRKRLRIVGGGIAPTSMDTPAHCPNRFSPLTTTEVNDEPLAGAPHPPVESDTDSVDFHAIHTPADNNSGEEIDDDFSGNSETMWKKPAWPNRPRPSLSDRLWPNRLWLWEAIFWGTKVCCLGYKEIF